MKKLSIGQKHKLTLLIEISLREYGCLPIDEEITIDIQARKIDLVEIKTTAPHVTARRLDQIFAQEPQKYFSSLPSRALNAFNCNDHFTVGSIARSLQRSGGKSLGVYKKNCGETTLKAIIKTFLGQGISFEHQFPLPGELERKAILTKSLKEIIPWKWQEEDSGKALYETWPTIGDFLGYYSDARWRGRFKDRCGGSENIELIFLVRDRIQQLDVPEA